MLSGRRFELRQSCHLAAAFVSIVEFPLLYFIGLEISLVELINVLNLFHSGTSLLFGRSTDMPGAKAHTGTQRDIPLINFFFKFSNLVIQIVAIFVYLVLFVYFSI